MRGPTPEIPPPDPDAPSHERILQAAKGLFASRGYENTTTVAIARRAGTSESQLMKHFGSKEGMLEAVFEESWQALNAGVAEAIDPISDPRQKLQALIRIMLAGFERDPALRALMLLEGRRIRRGGQMVMVTEGYREFIERLDGLLRELRDAGQLRADVPLEGVRSALIGSFESLMRDHLLGAQMGLPAGFGTADIRDILGVLVQAFSTSD